MPDYSHNDMVYEISIHNGQIGDLVDAAGKPVIAYYSRVRLKPPVDKPEDHAGWVLVTEDGQAAISRSEDRALLQAQEYIQNNPVQ